MQLRFWCWLHLVVMGALVTQDRQAEKAVCPLVQKCVKQLRLDLQSTSQDTKCQAIESLSGLKNPLVSELLRSSLFDKNEKVRLVAATARCFVLDDTVRKILKRGLSFDGESKLDTFLLRYRAAVRLAEVNDQESIDFLINCSADPDQNSRLALATELAETANKRLFHCAIRLFADESKLVRIWAAEAVVRMGEKSHIEALRRILEDEDPRIAAFAAESLGALGDQVSLPKIRRLMQSKDLFTRVYAASALARLGDTEGAKTLRAVVQQEDLSPEMRIPVLSAIGDIGSEEDLSLLGRVFDRTKDPEERRFCCAAILHIWERQNEVRDRGNQTCHKPKFVCQRAFVPAARLCAEAKGDRFAY